MSKPTFVFTDAHITGLGAMLAQGEDIHTAKPVAFASRTTSPAESRYPQLDLEAMGLVRPTKIQKLLGRITRYDKSNYRLQTSLSYF